MKPSSGLSFEEEECNLSFPKLRSVKLDPSEESNIHVLSKLSSLQRVTVQNTLFSNIHSFQRIQKLTLIDAHVLTGITQSMPQLQWLRCETCPELTHLSGLQGNQHMKISIVNCRSFCPDNQFLNLFLEIMDEFDYSFDFKSRDYKYGEQERISRISTITSTTITRQIRDKYLQCSFSLPFQGQLLTVCFRNLRALKLSSFSGFVDLSSLAEVGLHLIPIVYIQACNKLQSLYPRNIIPQHEWFIISECNSLKNIAGIEKVSRVSINSCPSLENIRCLRTCRQIDYTNYSHRMFKDLDKYPIGYAEIKERCSPFPKEISVFRKFTSD